MRKKCAGLAVAVVLAVAGTAQAATVLLVSDQPVGGADDTIVAALEGLGITVDTSGMDQAYREGNNPFDDPAKVAALDNADLVIVTRYTSSGSYDNDRKSWNEVQTPLLLMSGYITRGEAGGARWGWTAGGSGDAALSTTEMVITAGQEGHPFVAGVTSPVQLFNWPDDPDTPEVESDAPKGVYLPNSDGSSDPSPDATVVGTFDGRTILIDIPAGTDFDALNGTAGKYGAAGARRAFLSTWGYDIDGAAFGDFHTAGFDAVAVNTVATLIPEPGTVAMLIMGLVCLALYGRKQRKP